jgi:hypothetical protein
MYNTHYRITFINELRHRVVDDGVRGGILIERIMIGIRLGTVQLLGVAGTSEE